MKISTIAAIAVGFLMVVGAVAYKYGAPVWQERQRVQTSDASRSKGAITIGVDNFIGYWQLCSPQQKTLMRNAGYDLKCVDDEAAYEKRFQDLKDGKIQFAVATIDSYQLNAFKSNYPGLIVTVIDRSNGADGAVACSDKVKNIDDIKRGGLRVAFAPGTPSEHLIKVVAAHFDIPQWQVADKSWRIETKNSAEAARKCLDGSADIAVLWEPDITKTLSALQKKGVKASKLIATDFSPNTIIDVLLVSEKYARSNSEAVTMLLRNYFKTLYHYRQNADEGVKHALEFVNATATAETRMSADDAKSAMKGVAWVNLAENATLWFGIAEPEPGIPPKFGLIDAIERTNNILSQSGDLAGRRVPDANLLVYSNFIKSLFNSGFAVGEKVDTKSAESLSREFTELTEEGWKSLREIGTLRDRKIQFPASSDTLAVEEKAKLDQVAEALKSYPNARIVIEGHTGERGDPKINLELSQDREEAVQRYLEVTFSVHPNRMRAVGYGGKKPLDPIKGESSREYQGRLPRVVVKLVTEVY